MNALLNLTTADKKFIDDIVKPVVANWTPESDMSQNQQIDFRGSDDDIRMQFETYITQFMVCEFLIKVSVYHDEHPGEGDIGGKKVDYLSEYNLAWAQAWKKTGIYLMIQNATKYGSSDTVLNIWV